MIAFYLIGGTISGLGLNLFKLFKTFDTTVFKLVQSMVVPPMENKFASIKLLNTFYSLSAAPKTFTNLIKYVEMTGSLQKEDCVQMLIYLKKTTNPNECVPTRSIFIQKDEKEDGHFKV